MLFICTMAWLHSAYAVDPQKKFYKTQRITGSIVIDGAFTDPAWQTAQWDSDFTQYQPYEGKRPAQKTEFAILYDNDFIYVAIKAYDSATDSIVKRMTRRDEIDGDVVGIQFDSYHDLRTAFTFMVSAGGVKKDFLMSNNGDSEDNTWDPIWWVKTQITNEGWFAEMKIPLTQLRFGNNAEHTWGMQVARELYRKGETSLWQAIPRNVSGWVDKIGELNGLSNIQPKRQYEFVPYVVTGVENYEKEEGNPFMPGTNYKLNAGLDGKIGLTNNLTLAFTVNPDFGQVEADPSEVNLSAYESFYEEKRPFFIEGRNILAFPVMFGDGELAAENLFYSRRIGRRPHHYPELLDGEYAKMPDATDILGALKITGKTDNGWSIGILESFTGKEQAEIDFEGKRRFETVEPATNYLLSRVSKDFNKGNSIIGAMVTSTYRIIDTVSLNYLPNEAYTAGVDYTQYFKNKKYFLKGVGVFSRVSGHTDAINELQLSSARYFQRPDADYLSYDPMRKMLSGSGGNIQFGKIGGKLMFLNAVSFKSPGMEINDLGYIPSVDEIMQVFWMGYRIYEPFSIFRSMNFNLNQWTGWDFGGNNLYKGGNINGNMQFKNYWNMSFGVNVGGGQLSNGSLRGGPALRLPGNTNLFVFLGTDDRKKFRVSANVSANNGFENSSSSQYYNINLTYRPLNTLKITIGPSYNASSRNLQYVTEASMNTDTRYIFASLDQKVFSMSLRINYNITPDLTLQYWGQPFVAAGKYYNFKRITTPTANEYTDRYTEYPLNQVTWNSTDETFDFDENADNTIDYRIDNPNFNFKEFLSNLVLRWEYTPGSTLFVVWSQSGSHFDSTGDFNFGNNLEDLSKSKMRNVFMLKFTYRIGR